MRTSQLSCIYYPTTTVLVDDCSDFLTQMQLKMGNRFPCLSYSNPQIALHEIKNKLNRNANIKQVIGIDTESDQYTLQSAHQLPMQVNISHLYKQFHNPNRFNEISVLVIDYDMPDMTGEQLCTELKGSDLKIILLTGEADEQMAIKLFNAGLIDTFIKKRELHLVDRLKNSISEMQQRYFQTLTDPIIKGLATNEDSALSDPAFLNLFKSVRENVSASSYCLIELSGSFLFLDDAGTPTWLIIKTRKECEEIAILMTDINPKSPWADFLKRGEKIPYFSNFGDYFNLDNPLYGNHWHKAQRLTGKKDYYYAIVKELKDFSFDKNKISSFRKYQTSSI